ncbi:Transposon Ty3-G Gag-Pol polyprotein, partial [Dictyocoela roeselum]
MNKMFKDLNNVMTYIDDILIFNKNAEDHATTLEKVFTILNKNSISINFEKSKFGVDKIDFFGHEISYEGIKPNTTKLDNFVMKVPKTKKQLQRVLGLVNWFRPFI